jgi:hypothetical protein
MLQRNLIEAESSDELVCSTIVTSGQPHPQRIVPLALALATPLDFGYLLFMSSPTIAAPSLRTAPASELILGGRLLLRLARR